MKTLTKTTHIAQIRQADQSQLQQVCQLIDFTEDQYCKYMFEQYTAFVKRMFCDYPIVLYQNALYSPVMRGFWNNEATKRNETEFLPFATDLTADIYTVNKQGTLEILIGLNAGNLWLVDEFMLIHNHQVLINNGAFMHRYNQTLHLIK